MSDIINQIKAMPDFFSLTGATEESMSEAENLLLLKFSDEYNEIISAFGSVSVNGHELTGICHSKRLNVVCVTLEERDLNPTVPLNFYVIEQANIDGIVIWQSASGDVYQSMPGAPMIKLCDSISEYISAN